MKLALAGWLLAGCGSTRHWLDHDCKASIDPARESIAYIDDHRGAILRRPDGAEHVVAFGGCVPSAKLTQGILALRGGWRALIWGYDVHGGNMIESGSVSDSFACVIDFESGAMTAVDPALLGHDLRHFDATAGPRTGWVYLHDIGGHDLAVVDLDERRAAILPGGGETVVEPETIRTFHANLVQTDPQHPIYRASLVVKDFDPSGWPPREVLSREIAVGGRTDRVVASADGQWVAYSGRPYHVGMETEGPVADLGLVDLETERVVWEKLAVKGVADLQDLVVVDDKPWVLITAQPDWFARRGENLRSWIGPDGTAGKTFPTGEVKLTWLPGRHRVLVDRYCEYDLLDMPPR